MSDKFMIEDAECIQSTDKAILVSAPDFDEPRWIPQSMVHDDSDVWEKGDEGILIVQEWWAKKQGWI